MSLFGLYLVNFFLGEIIGVGVPFLNDYLKNDHWSFQDIGIATAMIGVGTLIFQGFSGIIAEIIPRHRLLLGAVVFLYGFSFSLLPFSVDNHALVNSFLLTSGMSSSFFAPLSATLAFSLSGHRLFAKTMGRTQMWNHAGFLLSAVGTSFLIHHVGLWSGFIPIGLGSLLAIVTIFFISPKDLIYHKVTKSFLKDTAFNSEMDSIEDNRPLRRVFTDFFRDPSIRILLISTTLFQIANAPVMPLLLLYLKFLDGGNGKLAWVVFIAQAVMIPTAWWTAKYSAKWGHKIIFSIAFFVMPIRALICSFSMNTDVLLATQILDGLAAGIYGVSVALIVSDLTRGKKGFNMLMGLSLIAMALGSVIGPILQGISVGEVGFRFSFLVFGIISSVAAIIFFHYMPHETPYPPTAGGAAEESSSPRSG
jgi:MFS family permease